MSVFCELLKFWPEFHKLSGSIQEDQLLPLLQEKRIKHRARVRRQRRKEEEEDERMRCQDELEAEKLSSAEDDDTDNDMDHTDEEKEKHKRTQSLQTSTQPLSWSYSKYMAALKREEVLLRRQCQLEESVSTSSDYSSTPSDKSAGSKCSHR